MKAGYAYWFDERVTIASDTAPTELVCSVADGPDVLVNECAYPDGTKSSSHSTPTALAELLADVNVDCTLLTHLFLETEPHADELVSIVREYRGATVDVATDHTSVTLD